MKKSNKNMDSVAVNLNVNTPNLFIYYIPLTAIIIPIYTV
jgi:hypothetical protein